MNAAKEHVWQQLPVPEVLSPVFALACTPSTLWVGGLGGVVSYPVLESQGVQQPRNSDLPVVPVTALLVVDDLLLVGGSEGIVYSRNGGATWQQANLEDGVVAVTAFAASPAFAQDQTVLAATLASGVLRSSDGGSTWTNVSFGLQSMEVAALAWIHGTTVLAATDDGLYRSRDSGRAWRRIYTQEAAGFEELVSLSDQLLLALQADGGLLRSGDGGASWSALTGFAQETLSLGATRTGALLAGTLATGLLRSSDQGTTWQQVDTRAVHALASTEHAVYAGTETGVCQSLDDGLSWQELPCPPVHDLSRLLVCGDHLVLSGTYSGVLYARPGEPWQELDSVPQPLTALAAATEQALFLSGPSGLQRVSLSDQSEQMLIAGQAGEAAQITSSLIEALHHVWAVSLDGAHLLHSLDGGESWQTLPTPFGVLPLVALSALSDRLLAATYDPRQYRINLWYSQDQGEHWVRSVEAMTTWPVVATCPGVPLLTVGNYLFLENAPGEWKRVSLPDGSGAIRCVAGLQRTERLFVLTTLGIQSSDDLGQTWRRDEAAFSGGQMLALVIEDTTLYVLCAGGRVWKREL